MSWNYTTKEKVDNLFKVNKADLQDWWCDAVEGLIDEHEGKTYIAVQTYTDEMHNGDGTSTLFVDHPPIVAVTALSVEDAAYTSSDYKVFDSHIELIDTAVTELQSALYHPSTFPVGVGNIEISYTSGTATVPARVQMCATQMVAAIAAVAKKQGADHSLKYSRITEERGDNKTITENFGLHFALKSIMKAYLKKEFICE